MRRFAAAVQQENGTYAESSRITWHIRGGEFSVRRCLGPACRFGSPGVVLCARAD
jgi:hypothetical protein